MIRVFALVLAAVPLGAAALEVVQPAIRQSDGGTPIPAGFPLVPGETLFLSFRVAGYQPTAESKVRLSYTIQVADPSGVPIVAPAKGIVDTELAPQDKEWKPVVREEVAIPPLAPSGTYRIHIQVQDEVAHSGAVKDIGFEVKGREVAPSDTLTIRNFRFYRGEDDVEPLAIAAYRPGDPVWARFDIIGYKYGANNAVDVTYGVAVLNAEGKVLWSQPEAAVERTSSFYPKRYVPGAMSINLQSNIRPGEYVIAVQARDAVGKQSYEAKATFRVE